MAPRRPTHSDWNPFRDFFGFGDQQQQPVARQPRRSTAERTRERARRPERDNRDTREAARATVPTTRRKKTQPKARTAPVRAATTVQLPRNPPIPMPAPRAPARRADPQLPGVDAALRGFRGIDVNAQVRGTIQRGPNGIELPVDQSGQRRGTFEADIRTRGKSVDADVRMGDGVRYTGPEVPRIFGNPVEVNITGVTIRDGKPVNASYRTILGITGNETIDPSKLPRDTGPGIRATVDLQSLVGNDIQLRRRNGTPVEARVQVDGDRMSFDITMQVDSGVIGNRREANLAIERGGTVRLTGTREANGTTRVTVQNLDVQGARLTMPTRRGQPDDSITAQRLRMQSAGQIVLENGRITHASLRGAQVTGLATNLTVRDPTDNRQATLQINDPANGASVRNINLEIKPGRRQSSDARGAVPPTDINFSASTASPIDVRVRTDQRGMPYDVRQGLTATLHNGTRITGEGEITWRRAVPGGNQEPTTSLAIRSTAADPANPGRMRPIEMTTRADLHGVNQIVGETLAAANFRLGMQGTLRLTNYDSSPGNESYDYSLSFKAGETLGANPQPANIRVSELPQTRNADTSKLRSGTIDGAQLDIELHATRTPDRRDGDRVIAPGTLSLTGAITGGITTGNVHLPYADGALDLSIDRAPGARTAVHVPINVNLGQNGVISAPIPAANGVTPETWAACQRTLSSDQTMLPPAVHGGNIALCASGVNIRALQQSHDVSMLQHKPGTVEEQRAALRAADQAFRTDGAEDARLAAQRTEWNAELDRGLQAAIAAHGIDPSTTAMDPVAAAKAFRVGSTIRNADSVDFSADIPLGERTMQLTSGLQSWVYNGSIRVQPDTTMRVEARPDSDEIRVHFLGREGDRQVPRPITIDAGYSVWPNGQNTFSTLVVRRNADGRIEARPEGAQVTGMGPDPWNTLGPEIASRFLNAPADNPDAKGPRRRSSFAATVLANIVDQAGVQIDPTTNPASSAAHALGPDGDYIANALRGAQVNRANFRVRGDTPIVFGNNFLTLAQPTTLSMTKRANQTGFTIAADNVTLGASRVMTPGRSMELLGGTVQRLEVDTSVDPQLTVDQTVRLRGIDASRVRMRVDEPERNPGEPRTSYEVGPANITGDMSLNMRQYADVRRIEQVPLGPVRGPRGRGFNGTTLREVVEPVRPAETTIGDINLGITGPITVRNFRIPSASADSGSAVIEQLDLDARNARITMSDGQVTVTSPEGSRARLRYSGELVAPQPTPFRVRFGPGSEAVATIHKLSTYAGDRRGVERVELDMSGVRARTLASDNPVDGNPSVSGTITVNDIPMNFRSNGAMLVLPRLSLRNFTDDTSRNFRDVQVAALSLPGTELSASPAFNMDQARPEDFVAGARPANDPRVTRGRANLRLQTDVLFAFSQFVDNNRSGAIGDLRLERTSLFANGGMVYHQSAISPADVEGQLQAIREFLARQPRQ